MSKFKTVCKELGIISVKVCFDVTPDVAQELAKLAKDNNLEVDDFMRYMVDKFIRDQEYPY